MVMVNDILQVLVGSRAHGLATPDSDWDYRSVFVVPTDELFKIGGYIGGDVRWIEHGKARTDDDTGWEVGKFLFLATKSNPTILEVFKAPIIESSNWGLEMRELFPYIWSSQAVRDAFIGYGLNQRKKFLDEKDNRSPKYAVSYLRVLYNAWELLTTGTFTIEVVNTSIGDILKQWKSGNYTVGEVMDLCFKWGKIVEEVYDNLPTKHQTDLKPINDFLVRLRREH